MSLSELTDRPATVRDSADFDAIGAFGGLTTFHTSVSP